MSPDKSEKVTNSDLVLDNQHPYLGLSSYKESDKDYFFGRDAEIDALMSFVRSSVLVVFFGKSGLGKSSLLRAGLFPKLRNKYFLPIYIRINFTQSKASSPIEQVKADLESEIKKHDKNAPEIGNKTLWEYFHRTKLFGGLVKPVLVFDQFEEVFTLGNTKQVNVLFEELVNLIENRVPLSVQEEYSDQAIPFPHLDQRYKVILSLREDYLPHLEGLYSMMPGVKGRKFRLGQLTGENALDAVYQPGKHIIEKPECRQILDMIVESGLSASERLQDVDVVSYEVEPFLLSLICERINNLRFDKDDNIIEDKITSELLASVSIKEIIENYYAEAVAESSDNLCLFIERQLLTADGYRRLQPLSDAVSIHGVAKSEIQDLIDKRIIRKEIWHGREQLELIHDVLVSVVRDRRDERDKIERRQEIEEAIALRERQQEEQSIIDEKSRKSRMAKIYAIVGSVLVSLLLFIGYLIYAQEQVRQKQEALAHARQLTFNSRSLGAAESRVKGLLAREAFFLNKQYDEPMSSDLYQTLYDALEALQAYRNDKWKEGAKYQEVLRDLYVVGSQIYVATKRGVILKWEYGNDFARSLDTVFNDIGNGVLAINVDTSHGTILAAVTDKKSVRDSIQFGNKMADSISVKGRSIEGRDVFVDYVNNTAYCGGIDGTIRMWNTDSLSQQTGRPFDSITVLNGMYINAIDVKADRLVVGTRKNGAYLIDLKTRDTVRLDIGKTTENVQEIRFVPGDERIIIGSMSGRIVIHSPAQNDYIMSHYHFRRITDIEFYQDNEKQLMATASSDRNVALWNLKTLAQPLIIESDIDNVYDVEFDPSGEFLFAGYGNGVIRRWPLSYDHMTEKICELLCAITKERDMKSDETKGNLTAEEWQLYMGDEFEPSKESECLCN